MKYSLSTTLCSAALLCVGPVLGTSLMNTRLAKFLEAPGARVTLPVSAAKEPFSSQFVESARAQFGIFHIQTGGDHALYYLLNLSEFMPTSLSMPDAKIKPLQYDLHDELGKIVVSTGQGDLTLDAYIKHPAFRHQGLIMMHKGKVVYETYPGMTSTDVHFWASTAKTTVGLVSAILAEEGRIDVDEPIVNYVPELAGSAWDGVRVIDALNHTTGLDIEETASASLDPNTVVARFYISSLGTANPVTGKVEDLMSVMRDVRKLDGEEKGDVFRYSSMNTHALTLVIESVEDMPWAQVFENRVWTKLGARMPAMFNLAADGTAMPFGPMSTTLPDMARYAMLFTPSWQAVASEQVVTPAVLERIQTGGNPDAFAGSVKDESAVKMFHERAIDNSYQFDLIFEDGAMYKSGKLNQGIYVDPKRDFIAVIFSTTPPYGETKAPAYMRAAAKALAESEKE